MDMSIFSSSRGSFAGNGGFRVTSRPRTTGGINGWSIATVTVAFTVSIAVRRF